MTKFRTEEENDAINSKAKVHRTSQHHSDMMDAYAKVTESIGFKYSRHITVDMVEDKDGVFRAAPTWQDTANDFVIGVDVASKHDDAVLSIFVAVAGYNQKPISNE